MVAARILTAGTRIVLTDRSIDHWATIDEDGGIVLTATGGTPLWPGRRNRRAVARGTKTCQGMNEWHVEDEAGARISLQALQALRDRAVASGDLQQHPGQTVLIVGGRAPRLAPELAGASSLGTRHGLGFFSG
ncbi:hypothetical protein [Streptomyces sp. NPDC048277]|uniref:hypothetical protein n=1 Tax=Streptomyces sp. NPDC048277 TaxID=3155027 RepID=UPI0033FD9343